MKANTNPKAKSKRVTVARRHLPLLVGVLAQGAQELRLFRRAFQRFHRAHERAREWFAIEFPAARGALHAPRMIPGKALAKALLAAEAVGLEGEGAHLLARRGKGFARGVYVGHGGRSYHKGARLARRICK